MTDTLDPSAMGPSAMSPSALVHDPATIARALAAEIPRLRRYARALAHDTVQADDLVQDCLERAWSRIHRWTPGTNLRAWLFTILHNIHVSGAQRRSARGVHVPFDAVSDSRLVSAGLQMPHMELRDVSRALDAISAEERRVVYLVAIEGLSYESAARSLAVPVGTVKSRLSRGRDHLRQLIDGEPAAGRRGPVPSLRVPSLPPGPPGPKAAASPLVNGRRAPGFPDAAPLETGRRPGHLRV